jgi:hypothetical protein
MKSRRGFPHVVVWAECLATNSSRSLPQAETREGLHVKCPLFLCGFNKNQNVLTTG